MVDRPDDGTSASSEPVTQQRAANTGSNQSWGRDPLSPLSSQAEFDAAEHPTLSSPSSEPRPTPLMEVEARVRALESHIEAMERELAEVYGAVEHLVKGQESVERTLQQQRHGRFLMWGTMIAILAMLWLTLRSRLGILGPR